MGTVGLLDVVFGRPLCVGSMRSLVRGRIFRIFLEYESRSCRVPLNAGRLSIARFRQARALALVFAQPNRGENRPGKAEGKDREAECD